MSRAPMPFRAQRRHPTSGRQLTFSAPTAGKLAALLEHFDSLRNSFRLGLKSREEIERMLRRLSHGDVTVTRAAEAYARREGLAPNTRARVLVSWLKGPAKELALVDLEALDAGRLQKWVDHLKAEKFAGSTIKWAWWTLRAILGYATARGWVDRPPWGSWRPVLVAGRRKEREAARTVGELALLFAAARALDLEARAHKEIGDLEARIAIMALFGLRQGELAGLRWRDVDLGALVVTIARQWHEGRLPKGRQACTLRGLPEAFVYLREQRARLAELGLLGVTEDGPVFPDGRAALEGRCCHYRPGGRSIPVRLEDLRAVVARAGLPNPSAWTATSLRDTFATLEAAAYPGDLPGLQARTRHASETALLRYLRTRSRALAEPGFHLPPSVPLLLPKDPP